MINIVLIVTRMNKIVEFLIANICIIVINVAKIKKIVNADKK